MTVSQHQTHRLTATPQRGRRGHLSAGYSLTDVELLDHFRAPIINNTALVRSCSLSLLHSHTATETAHKRSFRTVALNTRIISTIYADRNKMDVRKEREAPYSFYDFYYARSTVLMQCKNVNGESEINYKTAVNYTQTTKCTKKWRENDRASRRCLCNALEGWVVWTVKGCCAPDFQFHRFTPLYRKTRRLQCALAYLAQWTKRTEEKNNKSALALKTISFAYHF